MSKSKKQIGRTEAREMTMGEAMAAACRGEVLPEAIAAKYRISQAAAPKDVVRNTEKARNRRARKG